MPALSETQKENVRFHLAYQVDTVDPADLMILESRMDDLSTRWIERTQQLLDMCEYAFGQTMPQFGQTIDPGRVDRQVILAGDVNRSTTEYELDRPKARMKAWIDATQILAAHLGVPNYRSPEHFDKLTRIRRVR